LVDRAARVLVTLATVWFGFAVSWGLFGRVGGGHAAVVAARGIIGDNMLSWGIRGPVREYTFARPEPHLYYAHHPWGTFWPIASLMQVFGRHAYVPRLEPILMSVATPPLLYGIGRGLWGPAPGAIAALAYVVLPITLSFGDFPGFEVPLVFGCLLTTWGYIRFAQHWQRRWMLVSLAGVLWTANSDWEGYVFLAIALGALLVTVYLLPPRWFGRVPVRRFGQWWALSACIAVVTLGAYLAYFVHIGALGDLLAAEAKRAEGSDTPVADVLEAREHWIDLMFTPVPLAVGKLALPVFAARLVLLRRRAEAFPLAMVATAAIQYLHFKNGADVHIYWPLPFAPYWALSLGVLAATMQGIAGWALHRIDRTAVQGWMRAFLLGSSALVPLAIAPDGVAGLRYGRATGRRFDDRGKRIFQDVDKALALEWMSARMQGPVRVQLHSSMRFTWADSWALHRPVIGVDGLPSRGSDGIDRYFVCDLAFLTAAEIRQLADAFHVVAVGHYALVDRDGPAAPADGYVFAAREPNAFEWYALSGTDPVLSVRAAPWYTWELRDHFGQAPDPTPDLEPTTMDELRIAHNAAVSSRDAERARHYRARLVAQLDVHPSTTFTDGSSLLGVRYAPGVAPTLDVYFAASAPTPFDEQFDIDATVEDKSRWSLIPMDRIVRRVAMPLVPPPRMWKEGFIYVDHSEIRQRPGRESFAGFFTAPQDGSRPRLPLDGSPRVRLIELP